MTDLIELARLPTRVSGQSSLKPVGSEARLTGAEAEERASLAEQHALELEPVDRGRGAYVFLINSFVLEFVVWGYAAGFGTVQLYLSSHAPYSDASLAALGAIGTVALGLFYILPLPLVYLARRYPHFIRRALWAGLAVNVVAMAGSSFVTSAAGLIAIQGVVGGVSGAVTFTPVLLWMQEWFVARRGAASGFVFSGMGLGGVVFPLALSQSLERIGFPWTMRLWALITLVTVAPVCLTIRPRIPLARPAAGAKFAPVDLSFLNSAAAIPLVLIALTGSIAWFPVTTYLPNFVTSLGSTSPLSANLCLATLNAAWTLGALLIGWASDRLGVAYVLTLLGAGMAVAALGSWATASSLGTTFVFAVLFGACGGQANAWTALARDLTGKDKPANAAVVYSFMLVLRGVSCIAAPLVAATLYKPDEGDAGIGFGHFGFGAVQVFVGAMALASAGSGLYMAAIRPSSRRKHQ